MADARELILASRSAARQNLLRAAGVPIAVVEPHIDEGGLKRAMASASSPPSPSALALALAKAKAQAVSARRRAALVIGADQVLAARAGLLDKPRDVADARAQLKQLRGASHCLHTAVVLAAAGSAAWQHVEVATLTMRAFTPAFLEDYVRAAGVSVCSVPGAYQIEGAGVQLFEHIEGDYFAILGLPLLPLLAELRSRGALAS
jgi:septum formation protein